VQKGTDTGTGPGRGRKRKNLGMLVAQNPQFPRKKGREGTRARISTVFGVVKNQTRKGGDLVESIPT